MPIWISSYTWNYNVTYPGISIMDNMHPVKKIQISNFLWQLNGEESNIWVQCPVHTSLCVTFPSLVYLPSVKFNFSPLYLVMWLTMCWTVILQGTTRLTLCLRSSVHSWTWRWCVRRSSGRPPSPSSMTCWSVSRRPGETSNMWVQHMPTLWTLWYSQFACLLGLQFGALLWNILLEVVLMKLLKPLFLIGQMWETK